MDYWLKIGIIALAAIVVINLFIWFFLREQFLWGIILAVFILYVAVYNIRSKKQS